MRARLTLWIMMIITLVLWVTALVFWLYMRQSINDVYMRTQQQLSAQIASQLQEMLPGMTRDMLDEFEDLALSSVKFESVMLDVYSVNGDHMLGNEKPVIAPEMLPLGQAAAASEPTLVISDQVLERLNAVDYLDNMHQVLLVPMLGRDGLPYVLFFASSNRFGETQVALVSDLLRAVALLSPLIGLVSGWFISGIAVTPIFRAQELIKQLNPQNFDVKRGVIPSSSEVDALSREVNAAQVRIRAAFEAQERFLANVSHEIKTPIAVMMIESQTIDVEGLPEEVARFVDSVQDEMKRLGGLVESFLTLTRLQDGHDLKSGQRVMVNEFVMDSVEHCATMGKQQGVRLRTQLHEDGDDDIDTSVTGEPELLTTMLDNIIRNAIRFSSEGDVVNVVVFRESEQVFICVRDEGPGIPEDRVDNIFNRFAQTEQGRRRGRGHGLGLSIAQGIAELHRGSISVKNIHPGCEFKIVLPVSDSAQA